MQGIFLWRRNKIMTYLPSFFLSLCNGTWILIWFSLSYTLALAHTEICQTVLLCLLSCKYNFPYMNIVSYNHVVLHFLSTDRKLLVIELIAANVTWFKDNFVEIACIWGRTSCISKFWYLLMFNRLYALTMPNFSNTQKCL